MHVFVIAAALALVAQEPAPPPPVVGRWDLNITAADGHRLPSWLEVEWSGNRVLVGRFVGVVGSARPVSKLDFANDTLRWSAPPQWEPGNADFQYTALFAGDSLTGNVITSYRTRAPPRVRVSGRHTTSRWWAEW
jgi:hypothetical protein